jgi:NADH-quinone oxidoreductase subunit N
MDPILVHITDSLRVFAPELILSGTFLLVILAALFPSRPKPVVSLTIALIGIAASVAIVVGNPPGEKSFLFVGMLAFDGFAVVFKLVAATATSVVLVVSYCAVDVRRENFAEYVAMVVALGVGMFVMAAAVNLLSMFLAFELVSMTSYILTAHIKEGTKSSEAALKYVVFSAASSAVMLYGMSIIYGLTGNLILPEILVTMGRSGTSLALSVAILFVLAGLAYKTAAVPFHFWCPDVYEGAPTPVAAFLSVGPKAAGMAMLTRFLYEGFAIPSTSPLRAGIDWGNWQTALVAISALTMTVGNLSALWQTNVKRLLAYSSIAHAGYMLMAVATLKPFGINAMAFYVVVYLFMNLGAFVVVMALTRSIRSDELSEWAGLGSRSPVVAVLMAIFLFALAGMPPTAGFIGKLYLFWAAVGSVDLAWLAITAALNTVIGLYYYARILRQMFFVPPPEGSAPFRVQPIFYVVLYALAVPTLFLGIYWGPLWQSIATAGAP